MFTKILRRVIITPLWKKNKGFVAPLRDSYLQQKFQFSGITYSFSSEIHNKNDLYESVKNYKEILEHNENDLNTVNDLATVYYNHKCFIEAIPLYQKCIEIDPTFSPAYTHLARIYLEQNETQFAVDILNQNLTYHDNNVESLVLLGQVDFQKGKYHQAIERFKNCLKANPTYFESYFHIGICYRKTYDYEESIKNLKKYIKDGTNVSEGYNELGLTYQEQHEYEESVKCFEKALEIKPENNQAYKNIALAYINLKKFEKAKKYICHVPEELNNDFDFISARGYMLEVNGQIDEAISFYEKLTERFKKDYKLYLSLGNCSFKMGDFDKAEYYYHEGLRLKPQYFYYGLAQIAKVKKQYLQAIQYYENVIDIDQDNRNAYLSISDIYEKMGQNFEAIQYCYQAMEINPNNLRINRRLSKLQYMEGNIEEAAQYMKKCIEIAPQEADLYYQYGILLQELENEEEAEENFKKCLSLNPNHPLLQKFAEELARIAAEEEALRQSQQ